MSPPTLWNLNDFSSLNSPGACFFPHPERFSHSFPAGFQTPAHKAQPCHVHGWSPGLPAVVAIPTWAIGAGALTWEETDPPCWWGPVVSLLACCPCYPCGPFFHPGMPIAMYPGALPASSVSPAHPALIPHCFKPSPPGHKSGFWMRGPIYSFFFRLSACVCHPQLASFHGGVLFLTPVGFT